MNAVRCISLALIGACLTLALSSSALAAGEPATVRIRVEGAGGRTLLPQTEVTTTTVPVPVAGGTCSGTSAGGALYDAVRGNWKATLQPEGVEIDGIAGVNLPSFAEPTSYAYWSFWLNNEFAPLGACSQELVNGADVVFELQCYATGPECGETPNAPEHFLTATAPVQRVLLLGESATLTVGSLSTQTGAAEGALPTGAVLSDGSRSVAPGSNGAATISFAAPGSYTLQAKAPDSVPSDPWVVCVHAAGDGGCGTSPATQAPLGAVAGFQQRYSGPYALVADSGSPIDGHFYRHGPRLLSGRILAHEAVTSVSLELRRQNRGRCSSYDGLRGRFLASRCGSGTPFPVAAGASFSYLLPNALGPGRYVLDISAGDVAGNRTSLARGSSRIVFYVR